MNHRKKRKQKLPSTHQQLLFLCISLLLMSIISIVIFWKHPTVAVLGQNAGGSIPSFSHVFVIMYENHSYSQIIGNPSAPYINNLAIQYGSAKNFLAIAHPSLPNYIAFTSGGTQGITTDCNTCFLSNTNNIFTALETAGKT